MPLVTISITPKQKRSLDRKIRRAGRGSLPSEIRKAINQYLAGPRQIEAAFLKLFMQKAPKNLNAMLAQQKRVEKRIDKALAWLRQRPMFTNVANKSLRIPPTQKRRISEPLTKDARQAQFRKALSKVNRQYKQTFKKLADN
ncbi:hypothetical protein [Nitrospira sp. Nam74]